MAKKNRTEIAPNVAQADPEVIKAKLKKLQELRTRLLEKGGGLSQREIDVRGECEESLHAFIRHAWKYIDPAPYTDNWHIQSIAEHLEAVARGELRHLLVNQPPRTGKSSLISVGLIPWLWTQSKTTPLMGPQVTALYSSYAQTLSLRDSLKARRLIESPFYQRLWGERFKMTGDQNTKTRFENSKGGYRLATSVGGALTGEGAQILVADDAHNSIESESELVRKGVLDWWDSSLSTRHNDPKTGVFIVVMQRLHEEDLSGHILSKMSDDWTHIMVPMRFESDRKCITSIGFEDPRTEEGELLWPERFGEQEVSTLETALGPFASAAQLAQRPEPKGGGIIKSEWWQSYEEREFPPFEYIVAGLDTAYTEKQENDYSAMSVWGVYRNKENMPKIMAMYAWQKRLELHKLVEEVQRTATRFRIDRLLIEDKAAGHSVAQELRRLFGGNQYAIQLVNPKAQDKVARMYSIQHIFAEKIIHAPSRTWSDDLLIPQLAQFPKGKHDDLCFEAGTKIATRRGNINIENVIVGDQVLTPDGWKDVIDSGCTGIAKTIQKFGLSTTPEHLIFTSRSGYRRIDEVNDSKQLLRLNLCGLMKIAHLKQLSSMAFNTEGWEESVNIICRNQEAIPAGDKLRGFMSQFGNLILAKQYPRAMKYITGMVIRLISLMKIYSAFQWLCIVQFLKTYREKKFWHTWIKYGQKPACGINLKKGASGIENMLTNRCTKSAIRLKSTVTNAIQSFYEKQSLLELTFVPVSVGRFTTTAENIPMSVRAKSIALFATNFLKQKLEPRQNTVASNAKIRLAENEEKPKKVYNLTIKDCPAYFANGILVHNCDTTSMAIRWLRDSGWALRKEENDAIIAQEFAPKARQEALYDV